MKQAGRMEIDSSAVTGGPALALLALCFTGLPCRIQPLHAAEEEEPINLSDFESEDDIQDAFESGEISEETADELGELHKNPARINSAGAAELSALPGLEPEDAGRIVAERGQNGPYDGVEDLVRRRALSRSKWEKVKLFVTADPEERSRGWLRHESTLSGLPARDRTAIRLAYPSKGLEAGSSFMESPYHWIKGYAGYKRGQPRGNWRGPFWLQEFYAGHYRAGFFEPALKEGPRGFSGDDRLGPQPPSSLAGARKSAPFKGLAGKIGGRKWSYSGFYSKNPYPQDRDIGLEMAGGYLGYSSPRAHLGGFWSRDRAEVPLGPDQTTGLWGTEYSRAFESFHGRWVYARMFQAAGSGDDNFYFARIRSLGSADTGIALSYKRLGGAFLSRAGNLFAGQYESRISFAVDQKMAEGLELAAKVDEKARPGLTETAAGYRLDWDRDSRSSLALRQSYSTESGGSSRQVLRTGAAARFRPDRRFSNRITGELIHSRSETGLRRTAHKIGYRLDYRWIPGVKLAAEVQHRDSDLNRRDTETEIFRLETSLNPSSRLTARAGWENRFGSRRTGSEDRLILRLTSRW